MDLNNINQMEVSSLLMKEDRQLILVSPQEAGNIKQDVTDTSGLSILEVKKS